MLCAECQTEAPEEDLFCENCGAKLTQTGLATSTCPCGTAEDDVDEDGFCLGCGRRRRRSASDHVEEEHGPHFAAVSDRGLRHERNEDRFALVSSAAGFGVAVCDGVSTTEHAEVASGQVADGIARRLTAILTDGAVDDPGGVLAAAIAQVAEELQGGKDVADEDSCAPSTTLVAALVTADTVTVAWIGDSRAYWIAAPPDGGNDVRQLTRDHSWLNMVVDASTLSEAEAKASPQAHAITRWLGSDAGEAAAPEFARISAGVGGTLLLCTDGLWNYAPSEADLGSLMTEQGQAGDALSQARALVDFANAQGGRDNITVALLRLPPATIETS